MAKLKTGRHTSGLKEHRKNVKRKASNASKNKAIRTLAKRVEEAVNNNNIEEATKLLKDAFSSLDKAAKTNRMHKSKANRKKAQLSKKVNKASK